MPWSTKEEILCFKTYIATKLNKLVEANFCRQFRGLRGPTKLFLKTWLRSLERVQNRTHEGAGNACSDPKGSSRIERHTLAMA